MVMDLEGFFHTVEPGDSSTSLAAAHGLTWQTVWDHPENRALRQKRKHPNILAPGDVVFIPYRRLKEAAKATSARHRFVRKGIPEIFRLQFQDGYGEPLADEAFTLFVDGAVHKRGNLDGEGWLREPIPPDAKTGRVELGEDGSVAAADLLFGHLDPVSEKTGIQQRLKNLGYYDGLVDGEDSQVLQQAVLMFRRDQKLPESDDVDAEFLERLVADHKS